MTVEQRGAYPHYCTQEPEYTDIEADFVDENGVKIWFVDGYLPSQQDWLTQEEWEVYEQTRHREIRPIIADGKTPDGKWRIVIEKTGDLSEPYGKNIHYIKLGDAE